jgi:hypothetical protein|tara:strand:- start:735 stop:878 length:144 start_codon:yes stop_codon:yes gene_type:complete
MSKLIKKVEKQGGVSRWFQDIAALASVAAMGWTVLLWSEIAKAAVAG